ncbi:hypothetical protein ASPZODRAFT_19119 [Penicilliopsis zonata CBS 506.65]|uniref:Uncharacterized protein n=1 Tax=Penicilliopsis zonata CBS 506.65 TaxID=1073090 RepID=A0A1L9S9J0_9EURO|nr:hypothetical protein ASPZODRAFT_19119 [Penicilliopsis zonata CBS 506.65]OJJ43817.1 hypothetical protein ASPZODRAFT_19119 [Penicilliopsis zonata CBS 506.65]
MPLIEPSAGLPVEESSTDQLPGLPFPPLTHSHILHCSYDYWHPLYRTVSPKARTIPLTEPFLKYLRADGIVLPPGETNSTSAEDDNLGGFSDEDEDEEPDPSFEWPDVHSRVKSTIAELGGKVTPKLNWSAPKDATWISATNDLQCTSANDVYLLLKSSNFITHDLEHPFDGCVSDEGSANSPPAIPYHLVLRKYFNLNPSLEFRCFVRNRVLLCISQRDQNHFDFLFPMRDVLRSRIQSFFDDKLKDTFPDASFVFDVYIPPPHERVWLIDINPWADRTDPILFSWLEILQMPDPVGIVEEDEDGAEDQFVRLSLNPDGTASVVAHGSEQLDTESEPDSEDEGEDPAPLLAEFRLIKKDDPEAYAFNSPQYSAHKLPREVVDASLAGTGGMQEFMGKWQDILAKRIQEDQDASSDDD